MMLRTMGEKRRHKKRLDNGYDTTRTPIVREEERARACVGVRRRARVQRAGVRKREQEQESERAACGREEERARRVQRVGEMKREREGCAEGACAE